MEYMCPHCDDYSIFVYVLQINCLEENLVQSCDRTIVRVWWFITFSITLGICVYFIGEVYKKWERAPIMVSFATSETPIYEIPFPSVTICPEADLFNHTYYLLHQNKTNLTESDIKKMSYTNLICGNYLNKHEHSIFEDDFFELLENESLSLNQSLLECLYFETKIDCNYLFMPIITDKGVCFTFNMLDRSEIFKSNVFNYKYFHSTAYRTNKNWSMETGYTKTAGTTAYPRRAFLSGAKESLTVTLRTQDSWIDPLCRYALHGFKVMVHTSTRIPLFDQQYFQVPLNQHVVAAIQPFMISTSESVKMYDPLKRRCYFSNEKSLKFFKSYTSLNCRLECLANYTLKICGCVNFYMPRENDNNTYLCGSGNMECMRNAEKDLQSGYIITNVSPETKLKEKFKRNICNCLPLCTDLSYNVEISQNQWQWRDYFQALSPEWNNSKNIHLSRLTLFFKSSNFISSQRHELFGPTDFLANFGGLLGLFMGCSVLSLMEIIYFLTIRLMCNTRLYGYWAGPET